MDPGKDPTTRWFAVCFGQLGPVLSTAVTEDGDHDGRFELGWELDGYRVAEGK